MVVVVFVSVFVSVFGNVLGMLQGVLIAFWGKVPHEADTSFFAGVPLRPYAASRPSGTWKVGKPIETKPLEPLHL